MRQAQREAERERRKKRKEDLENGRNPREEAGLREERGHAHEADSRKIFCARPGCYCLPKEPTLSTPIYCCEECRKAVRRVLDRERKWLARARFAGRLKRQIEYQFAREKRRSISARRE